MYSASLNIASFSKSHFPVSGLMQSGAHMIALFCFAILVSVSSVCRLTGTINVLRIPDSVDLIKW